MTQSAQRIVFLDVETTGLRPQGSDRIYEVGAIVRSPGRYDVERHWWVARHDLSHLDLSPDGPKAKALSVGRLHDRHPDWAPTAEEAIRRGRVHVLLEVDLAAELTELLDGAVVVGANVGSFDVPFISALLARHRAVARPDYHYVEVESYAAGAAGLAPPWKLDSLLERYDIPVDPAERHTALGDARLERTLFDAAWVRGGRA